ncbi:MAG TPA: FadD3 family acyl-CoA ligase [Acidimicrobiales bacterium]|jgi:acyl-CoA synthetase (AMP-forming)/AMP-acid ligase II|nr:FadD3 family acyl-CoA ligase [Acidimicrobiales bacterium]
MDEAPWGTIPELLDDAARRFPDADALADGAQRWTFTELRGRVHDAARALIASGVAHGERIGIWAPNIAEWVVAALAVHNVGAVLVPVNTRFKGKEAGDVLGRSRVRRLFTVTDFLDIDYVELIRAEGGLGLDEIVVLRGTARPGTVSFDDFLSRGTTVDDAVRATRAGAVQPSDVCHILFTSGTTGAPKGAMLEHGQICRAYVVFADVVGLRQGDRYLIVNPFFHSFGLHAGILCCLMVGATIIPQVVFDPSAVMHRIADERITAFPGPPAVYQGILNHPDANLIDLRSLRLAILGAAAVPVELIRQMRDRLGIETVVTGYGITEASGIVTMCRHDDDPEVVANTAGRPLPGLELRVVDDAGRDVAAGTPGEVLVRGYNLMRAYLDDPEQTAAAIDAAGFLHTGDIGVIRGDGNLVITDRKKDMFIVGGFNAYPAEIENAMLRHPHVGQVAVIGVPDQRLGEVGMAFVIPRPDTAPDPDEIIRWCRSEFANYKVPRYVRIVDRFPLNATGKVLKYELRDEGRRLVGHATGDAS